MPSRRFFDRLGGRISSAWPDRQPMVTITLVSGAEFTVAKLAEVEEESVSFFYLPDDETESEERSAATAVSDAGEGYLDGQALSLAAVRYEQISCVRLVPGQDEKSGFQS